MSNESLPWEPDSPALYSSERGLALISLPSSMCLCVPAEEIGASARDLQTLSYTLEEALPLDAENMAIHVGSHLIFAADGRAVVEWYAGQEHGKQICTAAVPRAVLIVQEAMLCLSPLPRLCLIIVNGDRADVLSVCEGEVVAWQWTTTELATLSAMAASISEKDPQSWKIAIVSVYSEAERSGWSEHFEAELTWIEATSQELEAQAASRILDGTTVPLVNLTSGPLEFVDPLAPIKPCINLLATTVVLATVLICAALNWRASRYRAEVAEIGTRQEAIFRQLFPKQTMPVGVLSRIESEHRRLAAMKGAGSNIPEIGSSLPVMQSFWQAIPTDARFKLEILDFSPSTLKNVDGSAKTYADLEAVRLALLAHDFAVPALSASQTSGGVTLKLDDVKHTQKASAKASMPTEGEP